jgi:dTDP-4-amino-4,6-dideoxygalactose transaminase
MANSNSRKSDINTENPQPIAFIDLKAQQQLIREDIDRAIGRVLDHGVYIMGPEVEHLERDLAAFCGAKHAISCASGTDALLMVLMAQGIGPGDAVICPGFTYTATPEVIALLGATPVFCDVDAATFNLDASSLAAAVASARARGLTPRAIIAVDLFGHPADYDQIVSFAEDNGLFVLADAAQGFGGAIGARKTGTFGLATATSFFPAKPLGCYGDGGAIFTEDDALAGILRSIRLHGKGSDKYDIVRIGINGRLDTIQAAILIEKLKLFPAEIEARQAVADRYSAALSNSAHVPRVKAGYRSVWAQYTLRVEGGRRDAVAKALGSEGIPTQVYYPRSLNQQTAYRASPIAIGGIPVSERLPGEVLSLPMHPYLTESEQIRITDAVKRALETIA